jgi:predicted LPLAT superfamily acyltransferase
MFQHGSPEYWDEVLKDQSESQLQAYLRVRNLPPLAAIKVNERLQNIAQARKALDNISVNEQHEALLRAVAAPPKPHWTVAPMFWIAILGLMVAIVFGLIQCKQFQQSSAPVSSSSK